MSMTYGGRKTIFRLLLPLRMIMSRGMSSQCESHSSELAESYSHVEKVYTAAIQAVTPFRLVSNAMNFDRTENMLRIGTEIYPLNRNVKVVAFGKAVLGMVAALENVIGDHIIEGVASVPVGTISTAGSNYPQYLPTESSRIRIHEGACDNLPDESAESAAREILSLVESAKEEEVIISLISGGGSALLPCPVDGVSLNEKKQVMESLAKSGADINELNTFRKALSKSKGGKLAQAAYPSKLVALILSDVIGDPLGIIASGPTVPDHTHPRDVITLLDKYQLREHTPQSVIAHLDSGEAGNTTRELPISNGQYVHMQNILIGTNKVATAAASKAANALGYLSLVWSHSIQGEARQLGETFASLAHEFMLVMEGKTNTRQPLENCSHQVQDDIRRLYSSFCSKMRSSSRGVCLISGGEPTVTVVGNGRGGRNQEMALAFAMKLNELRGNEHSLSHCVFASVGTDGQDGPCDAAGAIVDNNVITSSVEQNLKPRDFLMDNDSYTFFKTLSDGKHLIRTGLTGTNVMDIHVLILRTM